MMKQSNIRKIGAGILIALWLGLTVTAWVHPAKDVSDSERRKLAQMPTVSVSNLLSTKFMEKFEDYTLDQFPFRDGFRTLKSLFHYGALGQKDNNNIYLADGYAAKLEFPLKQPSLDFAMKRFQSLYDTYLKDTGSKIYFSVVPDKGYYLAEKNGYPAMDYDSLFSQVAEKAPFAEFIDLRDTLSIEDYYRTDTHWRQEHLIDAAGVLSNAMGIPAPKAEDYTVTQVDRPFYGVYYGQAALPMKSETMYYMDSPMIAACTVYNHETKQETPVYNLDKLSGRDPYDIFLSGPTSLLTVENPNAETDRELIVFRDSFGSSMIPLLLQGYKTVTIVDIRYLASNMLGDYVDFHGQDVLFLYSTLLLNSSSVLK